MRGRMDVVRGGACIINGERRSPDADIHSQDGGQTKVSFS